MSKKPKVGMWSGLTAVTAVLTAGAIVGTTVAFHYTTTVNNYLDADTYKIIRGDSDEDTEYFKSDFTSDEERESYEAELCAQVEAEGAALLKNDNNALPLASGAKVSLFGHGSVDLMYGGTGSGSVDTSKAPNFKQALEDQGIQVNNTLWDLYSSDDMMKNYSRITPVAISDTLEANTQYAVNEAPWSKLSSAESSFADYGDAAIVVFSRSGGEGADLPSGENGTNDSWIKGQEGDGNYLALSAEEKELLQNLKTLKDNGTFKKIIVLINSSNAVEMDFLNPEICGEDYGIDSAMWIGDVGQTGINGVAQLLAGEATPSGSLVDSYLYDNMANPAMYNFYTQAYPNAADYNLLTDGPDVQGMYSVYQEGIYLDYRYYETRYADCVNGVGNAASPVGAYASSTEWNYDNEVAYGFGYGLSYTTFTQEIQGQPEISVNIDSETGAPQAYATFNVKVTNTGKVPGKTSVQIYGQAPYTEGGLEKVAIQLLNFEKSSELAPGASEIVSVKVDLQYIASYDMEHDNGDGTTGTYVLDPGTYYFAAGNGAHDALNNILVLQGADESKMVGTGSAAAAVAQEITEDLISRTAFSVSKTGEKISNQIPYADWNYYQPGEVTYLTRADWAGTFPKTYDQMTLTSEKLISDLNGNYYTIATDDDTSDIKWGENSNLMFYQMFGLDFDDPKWDELLDKMTLEEAQYLATYGGPSIPGVESIGTVETYMTENAGNGVAVNLNASKDTNAPWTIGADDPNGNWHPEVFANAPLVAASFNNELYKAVGEFVGEESLFVGIPILWGPGMNTHRQAYNGRNGEYYSEDPVLTGNAGMEFAIGALEYGLIAAPKHYAFNDQESERGGVSPYMTEQRAREIELRAYQIAFEATKYDTDDYDAGMRGLMTSFSKIGGVECTSSVGMNTNILKKEWGFKGYAVTDIYDDTDLYGAVLNSGVTCFDTRGISGFYGSTTLETDSTFATQVDGSSVSSTLLNGDANLQQHVKESAHNILYAMAHSNLMNRYNSTTRIVQSMTWWRAAYIALIAVSGVLTVACGAGYVFSVRKKSKKEVH